MKQITTTTATQSTTTTTTKPNLTFTTTSTSNPTTTISNFSLSMDFCPGIGKNIDCSATGDLIYLTDAFYGISSETPAVCAYK